MSILFALRISGLLLVGCAYSIDAIGVTIHITTLFEGHPDLITSFEKFSPLGGPTIGSTSESVTKGKEGESDDHSEGPGTAGLGDGQSRIKR